MRTRLELVTPCVTGMYSNQTELTHRVRAANETRTRDPDLGKVVLYQLSYCRNSLKLRDTDLRLSIKASFSAFNLHRHCRCGRRWIRTTEGNNQQIYSLPHLATLVSAQIHYFKEVTPIGFKPITF